VNNTRVIVALDFPDMKTAADAVASLEPGLCRLKVGKELFTSAGPALIEMLINRGFDVFLDLKFHDIPNTVARACAVAARMGIWMVNIHASGGREMLLAAREAIDEQHHHPLLIGVTVLTSLSSADLIEIGVNSTAEEQVLRLARLSRSTGLDGVVCSAREAETLKAELGTDFVLVTPGIRPAGAAGNDQKRTMSPAQAINAGSHYLVIGRPVTQAKDPLAVLRSINEEINTALKELKVESEE